MRVLVHDREGPRSLPARTALAGVACLVGSFVAAWFLPSGATGVPIATVACLGFILLCVAVTDPFRFASRVVDVDVRPGEVRVRRGFGSFRIRPSDVSGATTCHHEGKLALTMVLGKKHHAGRAPVSFLFDDTADAERVRAALGISREGVGETHFPTEVPVNVRTGRVFAVLALVVSTTTLAFYLAQVAGRPESFSFVFAALTIYLGIPSFLLSLIKYVHPNATKMRRIALRPEAAYFPTPQGFLQLPYSAIRRVLHQGGTLIVEPEVGRPIHTKTLLPADECAVLASHVEASRRRALGDGARRAEVEERLSLLMPGNESVEAWIRRLDGMASLLATAGYRGSAIDREDLRTALDDIDSPIALRLAAGRLLARVDPEICVRVVEAADTSPSEAHAKLFRICDGAAAEVAQAYAEVEAAETQAGIRSLAVARRE